MRPGPRTKVSVPLVLPQNRHPAAAAVERSASLIYRVTQRLWRGVEGDGLLTTVYGSGRVRQVRQSVPRRCRFYLCCSSFSATEAAPDGPATVVSLGPRTKNFLASRQILLSGRGGRKAPSSIGKIGTAEVLRLRSGQALRLRATSAVSRDKSVRRFAQDDDSVGELTERRALCGSRGALQVPRLRSG